jgi:hypothetical protein
VPSRPSPDFALVVAVVVVVSAVALVVGLVGLQYGGLLGRGFCHCSGNTPLGTAFLPGDPTVGQCPVGSTFLSTGCQGPADFYYGLSILESTIAVGSAWFFVQTEAGAIDVAPAGHGFSILTASGVVVAQYAAVGGSMGMSSDWTYGRGVTDGTPINTTDYIVIDMGTQNPTDAGLKFVAQGMESYTGTTDALALP